MPVCSQRPFTMTPAFCLMLNRICFSQNGNGAGHARVSALDHAYWGMRLMRAPTSLVKEVNVVTGESTMPGIPRGSKPSPHSVTVMWEGYILATISWFGHTGYHLNSASPKELWPQTHVWGGRAHWKCLDILFQSSSPKESTSLQTCKTCL